MDDVLTGIWIAVGAFIIIGAIKGFGMMLRYIGKVVASHLHEGLVNAVHDTLSFQIQQEVGAAVDSRFQTMELRVDEIHAELKDNGGDSLKDAVRRIEARQSKEAADRTEGMSKVWATLAEHGIERRQSDDQ